VATATPSPNDYIEIKKAEVNKWLQNPENQKFPFVKKEILFS
jgi:hypothetical protein